MPSPQKTLTISEYKKMRAKKIKEADVQDEILKYLALRGVIAFHIPNRGLYDKRTNRYNRVDKHHVPGVPDLAIILKDGRTVWAECKRPEGGVLSAAQQHLLGQLTQLGHLAVVVMSVEELETFLRTRGLI